MFFWRKRGVFIGKSSWRILGAASYCKYEPNIANTKCFNAAAAAVGEKQRHELSH